MRLVGAVLPGADEAWRERRWFDEQSVLGSYEEPREGAVGADDELEREAADVIELALTATVVPRRRGAAWTSDSLKLSFQATGPLHQLSEHYPEGDELEISGTPKTRRQHYLPQFFLREFADPDRLSVLMRDGDGSSLRLLHNISVKEVGFSNYLYESAIGSAEENRSQKIMQLPGGIEDDLSISDSEFARGLRHFQQRANSWIGEGNLDFEDEDRVRLFVGFFIAFLLQRSPETLDSIQRHVPAIRDAMEKSGYNIEVIRAQLERSRGRPFKDGEKLDMDALIKQVLVWEAVHPFPTIEDEQGNVYPLYEAGCFLASRSMCFLLTSRNRPFIGVSRPIEVLLTRPSSVRSAAGFGISGRGWYMPLSSTVAVLLGMDERLRFQRRFLRAKQLGDWNKTVLSEDAWRLAFCRRGDYLEKAKGLASYS